MGTAVIITAGVLALLLLVIGAFVAATWAPERTVAELQGRWARPPSVFVDVAGMRVHLRDEGPREDANPLMLLHGTGSSLHAWAGWVGALEEKERMTTLDRRG